MVVPVVTEAVVTPSVPVVCHLCSVVCCRSVLVVNHRANDVAATHVVDCSGVLTVLDALGPRLSAKNSPMVVVVVVVHHAHHCG